MAEGTKSTIVIAIISALSAIVVAMITTYGTIAVSEPKALEIKRDVEEKKIENLPIGTIVPSMLPPSRFAQIVGDSDPSVSDPRKSKWVLAEGQDVTASEYGKLLGGNRIYAPDLRGMFLRGMNENRNDGRQDPEQNRGAGDYQSDALREHGHSTSATGYRYNVPDAQSDYPWDNKHKDLGYTSDGDADLVPAPVGPVIVNGSLKGAEETRPKNVAVFFYVKIN